MGCLRQPEPLTSTSVLDGHHRGNSSHRRERPRRLAWLSLASPHLTAAAFPTPASAHLPDHTSAHAQRPPPQLSGAAELAFRAFPPSAATVVRGGRREGAGTRVGGG